MVRRHYGRYIKKPEGIVLRGDYSEFGADLGQDAPRKTTLSTKTAS
jgi:integrase